MGGYYDTPLWVLCALCNLQSKALRHKGFRSFGNYSQTLDNLVIL